MLLYNHSKGKQNKKGGEKMTYSYYIRLNNIKDSKQAFREYLEKYNNTYKALPDGMKKQVANANYNFRFIDNANI